jgi:hypothetical protein
MPEPTKLDLTPEERKDLISGVKFLLEAKVFPLATVKNYTNILQKLTN